MPALVVAEASTSYLLDVLKTWMAGTSPAMTTRYHELHKVRNAIICQYTAGSPLSVGLAITFLNESLIGTLRLMPFGGIGFKNHFS
jgi:hypothetical protein